MRVWVRCPICDCVVFSGTIIRPVFRGHDKSILMCSLIWGKDIPKEPVTVTCTQNLKLACVQTFSEHFFCRVYCFSFAVLQDFVCLRPHSRCAKPLYLMPRTAAEPGGAGVAKPARQAFWPRGNPIEGPAPREVYIRQRFRVNDGDRLKVRAWAFDSVLKKFPKTSSWKLTLFIFAERLWNLGLHGRCAK